MAKEYYVVHWQNKAGTKKTSTFKTAKERDHFKVQLVLAGGFVIKCETWKI